MKKLTRLEKMIKSSEKRIKNQNNNIVVKKKTTKKSSLETLSKNSNKKYQTIKEEKPVNIEDILQSELIQLEIEKEKIRKYTDAELAEWLIDKFAGMVELINYQVQQDFLNAENTQARFYKLYFATEFWRLIEQYEIDVTIGARDYLATKQEAELLDVLVFLNFV